MLEALPERLGRLCESHGPLGIFWVNIRALELFNRMFGSDTADQVLDLLAEILQEVGGRELGNPKFMMVERVDRGSLALIFQNGEITLDRLMDLAFGLRVAARHQLNQEVVRMTGQNLYLEIGCAAVTHSSPAHLAKSLYSALQDAAQMAQGAMDFNRLSLMDDFRSLVGEPRLRSVFQPVVKLSSGRIMGWEALARGPEKGPFSSPKAMFDFAEEIGGLFQLERCCREQAIINLGPLSEGQKLFLNIHPQTLGDPKFRAGETKRLLARHGLSPSDVVFEITERHSIKDFALFHRTLDHYRTQGFSVAIDDVGTGFSGLKRIARLRPEYIKADMGLVDGVASNPVQRALMETLVIFADKIGSTVIAEGIEKETDLSCLKGIGVHCGQGYYLGRPRHPKPTELLNPMPRAADAEMGRANWKCSVPIVQLVEPAPHVSVGAKVKQVKALLDSHPISGAVVVRDHRPVGLVMSHSLDRQLGTQYGNALYYNRDIETLMDRRPLIVDADTPVEQVAGESTQRERFKLYDHIIVTREGRSVGVVSVQRMLDSMARVQLEVAKGSNPLTGLPGGLALETEMERRCRGEDPTSLVYVDLDHFKVYNDTYGFKAGDRMIQLTAEILVWAFGRHGRESGFVGHVGGDDFVAIVGTEAAERACIGVVRCFKRLVNGLYNREHIDLGYVEATGRDGKFGRFPLVSISLGIVDFSGPHFDLQELGRRAAELKRYAKSIPGSVFVRDRRRPAPPSDS